MILGGDNICQFDERDVETDHHTHRSSRGEVVGWTERDVQKQLVGEALLQPRRGCLSGPKDPEGY